MNNSSSRQPKAEPKWQAISSLILGIISVLPVSTIIIYYLYEERYYYPILPEIWARWLGRSGIPDFTAYFGFFWVMGGWLFPITGFILGIIGLKYSKKKLAITGIILSIAGFVVYAFLLIIFSWLIWN